MDRRITGRATKFVKVGKDEFVEIPGAYTGMDIFVIRVFCTLFTILLYYYILHI